MGIRFDAILDVTEFLVEFRADRSGLAVLRNHIVDAFLHVINSCDRADDGSCATCSCFLKSGELFFGNMSALNQHTHIKSKLLKTAIRD